MSFVASAAKRSVSKGAGSSSVAPLPGKTSPCDRRRLTGSGKCAMLIFGSALSISESRLQMLIKCHPCPRTFVTHESGPYTAAGGIYKASACVKTNVALSRRPRSPVDHDGEWRGATLLQLADEEKAPAVGRRRIVGVVHIRIREIEQRLRQSRLERAAALHVHRHQLPVSGAIE